MRGSATAVAVLLGVFLLWEAAVRAFKVKPVILPAPSAVLADLFSAPGWYLGHAWSTLLVTLGGFALAVLVGAIVGEFVSSQRGLGYVILSAQGMFDTARVFAAILVLAVMGVALFWVIALLERVAIPWHASQMEHLPTS